VPREPAAQAILLFGKVAIVGPAGVTRSTSSGAAGKPSSARPPGMTNRVRQPPSISSSNSGGSLAIGSPASCITGTVIASGSPGRDLAKI